MPQAVASGTRTVSTATAYPETPAGTVGNVAELFPAVSGTEPPSALFAASAALLHAAAYSSGGSLTLLCLRLYDPTQTKLSLSACHHELNLGKPHSISSFIPHRLNSVPVIGTTKQE